MAIFLKNDRGFTLVEVLSGLAILSLIAIPMLSFFIQAADYSNRNKTNIVSLNIAQNTLVYMQKQQYNILLEGLNNLPPSADSRVFDDDGRPYYKFSCTPIFPSCSDVLEPTINGTSYISEIFMRKNENFPDYLIDVIVIVQVNSSDSNETLLRGVITNEKIR